MMTYDFDELQEYYRQIPEIDDDFIEKTDSLTLLNKQIALHSPTFLYVFSSSNLLLLKVKSRNEYVSFVLRFKVGFIKW